MGAAEQPDDARNRKTCRTTARIPETPVGSAVMPETLRRARSNACRSAQSGERSPLSVHAHPLTVHAPRVTIIILHSAIPAKRRWTQCVGLHPDTVVARRIGAEWSQPRPCTASPVRGRRRRGTGAPTHARGSGCLLTALAGSPILRPAEGGCSRDRGTALTPRRVRAHRGPHPGGHAGSPPLGEPPSAAGGRGAGPAVGRR